MGQCYTRCRPPGDLEGTDVFGRHREGAAYSLHNKSGPLTPEEKAIDEILGPLFELTLDARFGYQLCLHVFTALTRVARLCLEDQAHDPPMAARLSRLREVAWGVEELLANFSSRGWLLRLLCTSRLDAFVKWRLDDMAALAKELLTGEQPAADGDGGGSTEGGALVLLAAAGGVDTGKRLAAGLRNARRLREAVVALLPSVMAPHGGAGDPAAMETFMRRITPLVHGGDNPLRQLELQEEVQIAVASLSVGPHRALRHPDLQYFWWRHMAGLEEVPWSTLWPHLATFLGNTPRLSDGAGDTCAALALLRSTEIVRRLQAAVHRMGYANYVNAAELDMAFGPGAGSAGCTTLEEQLRLLMTPGRPILLARTSKGARAEGWALEASAAAAARQAAADAAANAERRATTAAAAAIMATRHASAVSAVAGEDGGSEADAWFDAASNFSRATSSTYMTVLAGVDDGSGIWPGRHGISHSQVLLLAGSTELPPRASGEGLLLDPRRNLSRRESIRTSTGRDVRLSGASLYGGPQAAGPAAAGGVSRQPPPNRRSLVALPPPAPSVRMSAGLGVSAQGRTNMSSVVVDEIVPADEARKDGEAGTTGDGVVATTTTVDMARDDQEQQQQRRSPVDANVNLQPSQPALETAISDSAPAEKTGEEGDGSGPASTIGRKTDLLASSGPERLKEHPNVEGEPGAAAILPPLAPGAEVARREQQSERGGDTAALTQQPPANAVQPANAPAVATGGTTRGSMRLVGRDEDINRLVSAIVSCGRRPTAAGATVNPQSHIHDPAAPGASVGAIQQQQQSPQVRSLAGLPSLLLVSGSCGCGKTALVTVAAERLVTTGVWSAASFADVRCAANAEDAALAMAIALNVPFYAADRPAGARLLSWLRSYGPQLRQGLVLDNVDLLLGLGNDESLELAHSTSGAGTVAATPMTSIAGAPPSLTQGGSKQQQPQNQTSGGAPGALQGAADRRWQLLRLLRDVLLAAPGLRLVLVSSPAVTWDLLQPSLPHDLGVAFHSIPRMTAGAAAQLLRGTLGVRATATSEGPPGGEATGPLMEEQLAAIVRACDQLPALVRLAGRAVRCGTPDLTTLASWAQEALRPAASQDGQRAAADVQEASAMPSPLAFFATRLVSHAVTHLPPDARGVLCCLVSLGCPMEEEDVTAAAAFLGHPGLVRAALCCLYDVGMLTYQSLSHRHDVVTHVRQWVLGNDPVVPLPDPGLSLGGGQSSGGGSKLTGGGRRSPRRTGGLSLGGTTSMGAGTTSGGGAGAGGGTTGGGTEETHSSGGGCVLLTPRSGLQAITEGGASRSSSVGGRRRRTSGRRSATAGGQCMSAPVKEPAGIRLCVLVQHLDGLLTQVGELYAHGCRVAALRLYNNGRCLADRALLLLPPWIARAGPACPAASAFAAVLCRHLNNICRHILTPNQLARTSRDLAQLQPRLTASYDRLIAAIAAARAHVHLLALSPAVQQLSAADTLAAQLYPQLAVRLDTSKRSGPPQSWRGVGGSGFASVGGAPVGGRATTSSGGAMGGRRTSGGEGSGIVARASASLRGSGAWELTQLAGIPPQVSQLALAHAELAAASGQYDTATRHLEAFLELLAAAGMSQSLEGAQAHMQLGDLALRRGRPPAEAAEHYNAAATLLMQLYGQSHFRVGRAMLAAARCSVDASSAVAAVVAAAATRRGEMGSGGGVGWGLGAVGLSMRRRMAASAAGDVPRRPLEIQLQDCLYVQQLSQGKFNLDVAEVEVSRGAVLCRRNQPDEALSCGLVSLGIVLEILGDGTPQVAECLALISKALRQKHKPAAAAAVALHAHAVRLHATAVAAVAGSIGGAVTAASFTRPPPTEAVVLQALADPSRLVPSAAAAVAAMAAVAPGVTAATSSTTTVREELSLMSGFLSQRSGQLPDGTPRLSARLLHSPIIQVPLPGGGDADTGADGIDDIEPPSAPRSRRVDLLQPSPRLVVLDSGDAMSSSDGLQTPSGSLSDEDADVDFVEETPIPEPSSSPTIPSEMVQHNVVRHAPYGPPLAPVDSIASGGMGASSPIAGATTNPPAGPTGELYSSPNIVRHVPYGPPMAPVDSVLSGVIVVDRSPPSATAGVAAAMAAYMPSERYGGGASTSSVTGSLCVSESPTSPSRAYGATAAPALAAAAPQAPFQKARELYTHEGNDNHQHHPASSPPPPASPHHHHGQQDEQHKQVHDQEEVGPVVPPAADPPSQITSAQSVGLAGAGWLPGLEAEGATLESRLSMRTAGLGLPPRPPSRVALEPEGLGIVVLGRNSSSASDVWADAPEEFPEAGGPAGRGGRCGGPDGAALGGDTEDGEGGKSPHEPVVSSVALAALLTAAGLPGRQKVGVRSGGGFGTDGGGAKGGREEDELDYIGMAPSAAPPSSLPKGLLTPGPATEQPASDGWCTPVRVRLQEPGIPHLHPSPLTHSAQRGPAVSGGGPEDGEVSGGGGGGAGDVSGDSPGSACTTSPPDFRLPPPPLTKAPPPSLAKTISSSAAAHNTLLGASINASTGLAGFLNNFDASVVGALTGSINGSAISDGTGTPVAQLSWSVFSPNGGRPTEDSRAIGRGGIVFPTPTSTPGMRSSTLAQRAPWLSWATAPDTSPTRTPRRPRELIFTDVTTPSPQRRSASGARGGGLFRARKTSDPSSSVGLGSAPGFMASPSDVVVAVTGTELSTRVDYIRYRSTADDVLAASTTGPPLPLPPRTKAVGGVSQQISAVTTSQEPLDTDFTSDDTMPGSMSAPVMAPSSGCLATSPPRVRSPLDSRSMSARQRDAVNAAEAPRSGSQRRTSSSSGAAVAVRAVAADVRAAMMALMGTLQRDHGEVLPGEDDVPLADVPAMEREGLGPSAVSVTVPCLKGKASCGGSSRSPRWRSDGGIGAVEESAIVREVISPTRVRSVAGTPAAGSPRSRSDGGAAVHVVPISTREVTPPSSPTRIHRVAGTPAAGSPCSRSDGDAAVHVVPISTREVTPPSSPTRVRSVAGTPAAGSPRSRSDGSAAVHVVPISTREVTPPSSPTRIHHVAGTPAAGSPRSRSDGDAAVHVVPTSTREVTLPSSPTRVRSVAGTPAAGSPRSRSDGGAADLPPALDVLPLQADHSAFQLNSPGRERQLADLVAAVAETVTSHHRLPSGSPVTRPASPAGAESTSRSPEQSPPRTPRHSRPSAAVVREPQDAPPSPVLPPESVPLLPHEESVESPRTSEVVRFEQHLSQLPSLELVTDPALGTHDDLCRSTGWIGVNSADAGAVAAEVAVAVAVAAEGTQDLVGLKQEEDKRVAAPLSVSFIAAAAAAVADGMVVGQETMSSLVNTIDTMDICPAVTRELTRVLSKSEGGVPSNGAFAESTKIATAASGAESDVLAEGHQTSHEDEAPLAWVSTYAAPLPPLPLATLPNEPARDIATAPTSPHPDSVMQNSPWHILVGGNADLASRRATAPSAPSAPSALPSPARSDRSCASRIPRTPVLSSPVSHSGRSGIPTPPPPPLRPASGHTPNGVSPNPASVKGPQRQTPRANPAVWSRMSSRPSPNTPKVPTVMATATSTPTSTRIPPRPPSVRGSSPRSAWSKIPVSPVKPSPSPALATPTPRGAIRTSPAAGAPKGTTSAAATTTGPHVARSKAAVQASTTPAATARSSTTPVGGSTPPAPHSVPSTTDTALSTVTVSAAGMTTPTQSDVAAWTLYASPAFAVQDTSTSPRADAEGIPMAESPPEIEAVRVAKAGSSTTAASTASASVITSPAARKAGSYTAAYLIQIRQHQKAVANPYIAAKTPTSTTSDPFLPTTIAPGGAASGGGAHPPVSIHLHNPLFVSHSPSKANNGGRGRPGHVADDLQEEFSIAGPRSVRHIWFGSEGGATGSTLGRAWLNVGLEPVGGSGGGGGSGSQGDAAAAAGANGSDIRSVGQSLRIRSSPSKILNWREQRAMQTPSPNMDAVAPQINGQSETRTSVIAFLRAGDRTRGVLRGGSLGI